jgi:hypothetical protein
VTLHCGPLEGAFFAGNHYAVPQTLRRRHPRGPSGEARGQPAYAAAIALPHLCRFRPPQPQAADAGGAGLTAPENGGFVAQRPGDLGGETEDSGDVAQVFDGLAPPHFICSIASA